MGGDSLKAPLDAAVRLLARREHSRRQLAGKLSQRGHSADAVRAALARLAETGLQSDRRFAVAYVRETRDKFGDRRLRDELMRRGVGGDDIDAAIHAECKMPESERLAAVLDKKMSATPTATPLQLYRFLSARGFSDSNIRRALALDRDASA